MTVRKITIPSVLVIAVILQCALGQVEDIQFQLEATAMGSEAMAAGMANIFVAITVLVTPSNEITPNDIVVTISVVPAAGTAQEGSDFNLIRDMVTFDQGANNGNVITTTIDVLDDPLVEGTETFIISGSVAPPASFVTGRDTANVTILDNDVPVTVGDDPHFSIVLPSGKLLCYTVQGEHGFVFNLISNKLFHMNAMFVPDSRREEVTWLGSMGIIVQNSQYKNSNATYLRFETKGKKIYIGDKVTLQAKNIEKLSFKKGKMTISEALPYEGFRYPSVLVDFQDVGLNFTIKFLNEHLDLFWHNTGKRTKGSHGLIGQFFRKGVEIDTVRKILILPGKEPVPVMRRPVWSFMEREVADDQLCWTAMNPGYQGEGLIDGTYFDYLVNDVLSTDFTFKKQK